MTTTKIDTIKALYTYTVISIVVLAGGASLVLLPSVDNNTKLIIAGFVGAGIQFLTGLETATRSARSTAAATAAGAATVTNGHTNGNGAQGSH